MNGGLKVVTSAGVNQKPGESRLELLGRNAHVFQQIIPSVLSYALGAVLLIANKPMHIMMYIAAQIAKE